MEWVETTARTVEEAKELALDQLGVVADEAEFEVLAEPKQGLFGRLRGEARVRARVRPAPARPKQDRRRGRRPDGDRNDDATSDRGDEAGPPPAEEAPPPARSGTRRAGRRGRGRGRQPVGSANTTTDDGSVAVDDARLDETGGTAMSASSAVPADDRAPAVSAADIESVRHAAVAFVSGLSEAFGFDAAVEATVEGNEIDVQVGGSSLGLLIGPGGRTLLAIQDLARVAAQRRLGDHETRLRVDVAGYRDKRRQALERFAETVAAQVRESGVARSLDPMPSADRKVLHDALAAIDGVSSRSEGEDPNRRVVVTPA